MVTGIVGANGFIGKHMCRAIPDAIPITRKNLHHIKKCRTIFNVAGESEKPFEWMMESNFFLPRLILEETKADYFHAGSSVEYGANYSAPDEDACLSPISDYGVTKAAASTLIRYFGSKGRRCCNLRLYCVYGEGDRENSLISTVIQKGNEGKLPKFDNQNLCRDFIHVSDVCQVFILAAKNLKKKNYGEAFNIGTGKQTTLKEISEIAKKAFSISEEAKFNNKLPYQVWYSDPRKARDILEFNPKMEISSWITKQSPHGQ